jgi:perosamine synthetase
MIPIYSPYLSKEDKKNVKECLTSNWISSQGKFIKKFESEFAKLHNVKYAIATSSCTTALHLSLVALDIGYDDEVICTDLTFIAPVNMINLTGAKPVLIDIDKKTLAMSSDELEKRITKKTKAIIVVHPFGHAAQMDKIIQISKKYNLHVIEDVAEAVGGKFNGKLTGTFGDLSCYSFFANKVITTGEGGMILTKKKSLYNKIKVLRDHGMSLKKRYFHIYAGYNYRMTNMQAAIGYGQIKRFSKIINLRNQQIQRYQSLLPDTNNYYWRAFEKNVKSVHWLATLILTKASNRNKLIKYLSKNGVEARPMIYPVHMALPYKNLRNNHYKSISKDISLRSIHLPSSLNLKLKEQKYIVQLIKEWF